MTSLLGWLSKYPIFWSSLTFWNLHVSLNMTLTASHNCPFRSFPQGFYSCLTLPGCQVLLLIRVGVSMAPQCQHHLGDTKKIIITI